MSSAYAEASTSTSGLRPLEGSMPAVIGVVGSRQDKPATLVAGGLQAKAIHFLACEASWSFSGLLQSRREPNKAREYLLHGL